MTTPFVERYHHRAAARAEFGALADAYARFYRVGDPLADAVAAWLATDRGGRAALRAALAQGPGPATPAPLAAFVDAAWTVPGWVDFPRMRAGAHLQQRLGRLGLMILGAWGLVNGYHSAPAVKPLVFTGQLERLARRRLAETSHYVLTATADDALRPGRPGWQASLHVRLMHATVRRMIRERGGFDEDAWGLPINQADMAGTLVEFSAFIILGARQIGFRVTEEEAEGLVHLWRYAGYLGGVHADLLAHFDTAPRLERLAHLIKAVQPGPDADSVALTHAMRRTITEGLTGRERLAADLVLRYHDGLSWALNVPPIAADLQVPHRRWRHVVRAGRPLIRAAEAARRWVPGLDAAAARSGRAATDADVARLLDGVGPAFEARRV
ncbi:MAG: DUF2236 domain-containing protein [Myxococcales bacterium]|nr:DUF2236 domain-containing protein [Myxococcales bacterium]